MCIPAGDHGHPQQPEAGAPHPPDVPAAGSYEFVTINLITINGMVCMMIMIIIIIIIIIMFTIIIIIISSSSSNIMFKCTNKLQDPIIYA